MIIDFHTHVFPEKIAKRTIELLSEKGGIPPFSDGTAGTLKEKLRLAGVDIAVTLPVLTNPLQFEGVNRFALELNLDFKNGNSPLLSFAGIHPLCEDIKGKMRYIKDCGFKGVKIHPDYQGTFIDHEGYIKIIEWAKELDLIVVTHAGVDFGFPGESVKCPPELVKKVIKKVPYSKLVLAHLGANEMFGEVLEALAGEDVYFDTAYVLRSIGKEMFTKILEKHGSDRILFASDSPWSDIKGDVGIIKSFGLSPDAERKIFSENAKGLLGI